MWLHTFGAVLATVGLTGAVELTVAAKGGNATSPLQYGVMFEDINHSGDGGIYAELIRNRAFQADSSANATTAPWGAIGGASLTISPDNPLSSALPYSMKVAPGRTSPTTGFQNPGWWGINVVPQVYTGSFWVYGAYNGSFTVALQSDLTNDTFASKNIPSDSTGGNWIQYNFTLNPQRASPNVNNTFAITYDSSGAREPLQFNLISLFPPTFNGRANGLRIDLMETLQALSPSYLRFPGGNNLEGYQPSDQWKWNLTIGPLTQRPGRTGQWSYYNTDGLGLDEYFGWCEDLDVEPILGVWDGQHYQSTQEIPQGELDPYVQDVLNELEYILGSTNTHYGALRAQYGHPDPWKLNYVEIGNEDELFGGLASYQAYRLEAFKSAINKAYPSLHIISSVTNIPLAPGATGDYHIYTRPDYLVTQFNLLDSNTSTNPTLIGEYANVQYNNGTITGWNETGSRTTWPFWAGSVAEAVFLIGAERNGDAVIGASYAPTLQNLNSYEWSPDLISFTADPGQTVRSSSYQVERLLSETRFTETRPVNSNDSFGPAYWVAGQNTNTGSYILKTAVYNGTSDFPMQVIIDSVQPGTQANLTVLTAPDGLAYASIGSDPMVRNTTTLVAGDGGLFNFTLPGLSVSVLETQSKDGMGGPASKAGNGGYGGCKNGGQRQSFDWGKFSSSKAEGNGCC